MNRRKALGALLAGCGGASFSCSQPVRAMRGYRMAERMEAIHRGMSFLYTCSGVEENFLRHGEDLLWCFYSIAECITDPEIKRKTLEIGRQRALEWRRLHPKVPADAGVGDVTEYAYGSYCSDLLGLRDERIKEEVRSAAAKVPREEFFGFDPTKEGPPGDIPRRCKTCRKKSVRGVQMCPKCGNPLRMEDRYDILCDAVICSYSGDRYGVRLGGSFAEVAQWIPTMRPYRVKTRVLDDDFYGIAYAVTHIIYAFNDYSLWRLKRDWLPQEYAFLREHLDMVIDGGDFETVGEFIDSLGAFGVTDEDPGIRRALDLILSKQNKDGSWGDPKTSIIYDYYHSTWTAVGGMMEIGWRGEGVIDPAALQAMQQAEAGA
ncbi:MAG: hypothetical protein HY820_39155 [Acidobacteria bacterium]|nr:hypothetical protein [Acidobacteriota bacterium]